MTQLTTLFGNWYDYNLLSWTILIGVIQPLFDFFFLFAIVIARVQAFSIERSADPNSSDQVTAFNLGQSIQEDFVRFAAVELGTALVLGWNANNWVAGQNAANTRTMPIREPITASDILIAF